MPLTAKGFGMGIFPTSITDAINELSPEQSTDARVQTFSAIVTAWNNDIASIPQIPADQHELMGSFVFQDDGFGQQEPVWQTSVINKQKESEPANQTMLEFVDMIKSAIEEKIKEKVNITLDPSSNKISITEKKPSLRQG